MKKNPSKIIEINAGGGVVFRENPADPANPLVLLIFRNGVWDLPKGKQEPGEGIEECARREVSEEVKVELPRIITRLPDSYHEYADSFNNGALTGKTTAWFAMQIRPDEKTTPQTDEGITDTAWIPLDEAKQRIGYPNLSPVLEAFGRWFKK